MHQQSSARRLPREELFAELERARQHITDLEADRWQSHERLIDTLAEHLHDGFSLLSPDGVHLDVNPAFCAMVGYKREELIGVGLPHPYWPPKEQQRLGRGVRRRLEGEAGTSEATFMRKDGERVPVLITQSVIRDEAGEPVCVFAIIRDISEQKRAEVALRLSEARYARAQEVGRVGSWEYDPMTASFWGSAEARRIYGLDPDAPTFSTEEVEGITLDRERVHQALVDLINEGREFDLEYEILAQGSLEPRMLWAVAEVRRDEHGDPLMVTGVVQDITERKRVEDALRESEARYRSVVENAPVGMFQSTPAGQLIYVNPACATIFGYASPAEIIAVVNRTSLAKTLDGDPSKAPRFVQAAREAGGSWIAFKNRLRDKDGSTHVGLIYLCERRDPGGGEASLYGFVQDVTAQEQAAKALERSARLLGHGESLAHLGSWEWDVASDMCAVSEEWQRMHGLVGDHLSNAEIALTCHEDDRQAIGVALAEAAGGGLYRVDHRIVHPKTREVRHLRSYGEPVFDAVGRLETVIGASLDVTERVRADEVLREREERLRRALGDTVAALGATVAMRDPYTAGHQRRVAWLACRIAERLGWSEEAIERVHTAALVHDVGKIAIPAEILSKPARLTETEFELVKAHSQAAYDILSQIEFDGPVADIVVQHHERLDGCGYPKGLRGDEILPGARVLAVADVVEAMITHRPYRAALPLEEALAEIGSESRGRYDAEAAKVCSRLFKEEGFTLPE